MKVLTDRGKRAGRYRFLKYSEPDRILNITDEDWIIIVLGVLTGTLWYSFKHKIWIWKF